MDISHPVIGRTDRLAFVTRIVRRAFRSTAVLAFLVVLCVASGCRSRQREVDMADKAAAAVKVREAGEKAMDNVLKGLMKADYKVFAKSFTLDMREAFPEQGFAAFVENNFRKKYGDAYESREFLGELSVGELSVLLWKARFKNYKNDVLLRLDVGEVDGDVKVFRFLIQ